MGGSNKSSDAIEDVPSQMHRVRERQRVSDQIHSLVIQDGAYAAAAWGSGAIAASLAAQRYSPFYRRLQLPFKLLLITAVGTGAFFTVTDRSAMRRERELAQKYSVTKANELTVVEAASAVAARPSALEELKYTIARNKFKVVGVTYFATLGGALAYNFSRRDISLPQKLINGRLTAQVAVLGGVMLIGWLTASVPKAQTIDPYYERIVGGDNSTPARP